MKAEIKVQQVGEEHRPLINLKMSGPVKWNISRVGGYLTKAKAEAVAVEIVDRINRDGIHLKK